MTEQRFPTNRDELMEMVTTSRAELERLVGEFSPGRLEVAGSTGWAAKDHMAHVAAWEKSLMALLHGEDRGKALGIEAEDKLDADQINEIIFERHKLEPLADVIEDFHTTHQRTLRKLESMTWDDLNLPYSHYQPNVPPHNPRPVGYWVSGNTYAHYDEHVEWLEALLEEISD